jgi:hypothetical protein
VTARGTLSVQSPVRERVSTHASFNRTRKVPSPCRGSHIQIAHNLWRGIKGPISGTVLYGAANVPTSARVLLFTGLNTPEILIASKLSAMDGTYSFINLAAGKYWVMHDGGGIWRNMVYGPFVLA